MRPWILQLGPLVVPTDAREEMMELHVKASPEQYIENVWAQRYPYPSLRPSEKGWPIGADRVEEPTNIIKMERP